MQQRHLSVVPCCIYPGIIIITRWCLLLSDDELGAPYQSYLLCISETLWECYQKRMHTYKFEGAHQRSRKINPCSYNIWPDSGLHICYYGKWWQPSGMFGPFSTLKYVGNGANIFQRIMTTQLPLYRRDEYVYDQLLSVHHTDPLFKWCTQGQNPFSPNHAAVH